MVSSPVKIAILSTANIAHLVASAINAIPEAECAAVGSRDINKAKAFSSQHNIPTACTYNDLLTASIDAVYIPLPTSMKCRWAVLFAKAGKHVLVEKPLGTTKELQDILKGCEEAGVIFLDGTHFVHSSRTKEIQHRITAGDIGTFRRIEASFSVPISRVSENIRSDANLEPQGFLGDLGWYCARAAVSFLGYDVTSSILSAACSSSRHPSFPDCIQRGSGVVEFATKTGKVCLCYSFDSAGSLQQRITLVGEQATIEIPDFVIPLNHSAFFQSTRPPEKYTTDTEYTFERSVDRVENCDDYDMIFPSKDRIVVQESGNRTYPETMIHEFCRLILHEDKKSAKIWMKESLATQAILDAMMAEVQEA